MVSCEGRRRCWTTSSSEGRSCGQKEVDSESILNFSLPFVRIFPWIKGLFWCKIVGYYPGREVVNIASWWVCDHETLPCDFASFEVMQSWRGSRGCRPCRWSARCRAIAGHVANLPAPLSSPELLKAGSISSVSSSSHAVCYLGP